MAAKDERDKVKNLGAVDEGSLTDKAKDIGRQATESADLISEKLKSSRRKLEPFSVAAKVGVAVAETAGAIKKNLDADAATDKILAIEQELAERATKIAGLPADKKIEALVEMENMVQSKLGEFEGMNPEVKLKAINNLNRTSAKLSQNILVEETKRVNKKRAERMKASNDMAAHYGRTTKDDLTSIIDDTVSDRDLDIRSDEEREAYKKKVFKSAWGGRIDALISGKDKSSLEAIQSNKELVKQLDPADAKAMDLFIARANNPETKKSEFNRKLMFMGSNGSTAAMELYAKEKGIEGTIQGKIAKTLVNTTKSKLKGSYADATLSDSDIDKMTEYLGVAKGSEEHQQLVNFQTRFNRGYAKNPAQYIMNNNPKAIKMTDAEFYKTYGVHKMTESEGQEQDRVLDEAVKKNGPEGARAAFNNYVKQGKSEDDVQARSHAYRVRLRKRIEALKKAGAERGALDKEESLQATPDQGKLSRLQLIQGTLMFEQKIKGVSGLAALQIVSDPRYKTPTKGELNDLKKSTKADRKKLKRILPPGSDIDAYENFLIQRATAMASDRRFRASDEESVEAAQRRILRQSIAATESTFNQEGTAFDYEGSFWGINRFKNTLGEGGKTHTPPVDLLKTVPEVDRREFKKKTDEAFGTIEDGYITKILYNNMPLHQRKHFDQMGRNARFEVVPSKDRTSFTLRVYNKLSGSGFTVYNKGGKSPTSIGYKGLGEKGFLGIVEQVYGRDIVKEVNTRFKKEYRGKGTELETKKSILNEILTKRRKGE